MNKIITHWMFPIVTVLLLLAIQIKDPNITEIARLKQFDLILMNRTNQKAAKLASILNAQHIEIDDSNNCFFEHHGTKYINPNILEIERRLDFKFLEDSKKKK